MAMAELRLWCRVRVVRPDATVVGGASLRGPGPPDMGAVEHVASLLLEARRLGARLVLSEVCDELADLLELAGLTEMTCPLRATASSEAVGAADSAVEMQGQTEGGKEALGVEEVEEEAHLGDGPV